MDLPTLSVPAENVGKGRIESVQFGPGFLVVEGWVLTSEGQSPPSSLTLQLDGVEHRITGLFVRDDAPDEGDGSAMLGFCADLPAGETRNADARVALFGPQGLLEVAELRSFGFRTFRPHGAIDSVSGEVVSGWVYDPSSWHGTPRQGGLRLTVGGHKLPISLDVRRYDLPYSAARGGRSLGFQVSLFELMTRLYGKEEAARIRAQNGLEVALVSNNFQLASTPLPVEAVAPAPTPAPAAAAAETQNDEGVIEIRAYSDTLGGWLLYGWVRKEQARRFASTVPMLVDRKVGGQGVFLVYPRADVADHGFGLIGFFKSATNEELAFETTQIGPQNALHLRGFEQMQRIGEREAIEGMRAILRELPRAENSALAVLLKRPFYEGVDTVHQLGRQIYFEIDELIEAPGEGAMLIGWFVDPTGDVQSMRVRSAGQSSGSLFERWLRFDRPDILEALGKELGLEHPRWGYQAYAALPGFKRTEAYVELTLRDGTIAFKPLPRVSRSGRAGILRALHDLDLKTSEIKPTMNVVAPMIAGISRHKLSNAGAPVEHQAGKLPEKPRCSMLIPLYGRLDFLTYQTALFSEHDTGVDEYIFVLDQPERATECLALARAAYQRVGMPFRLLVLPENLGFAGASNAGLTAARGDYICFLNSDVMPKTPDWMDKLIAAFEADNTLGLLSARLLFEDGTVQHIGMDLERQRAFGDMLFPYHPSKGRMPPPGEGVRRVPLATGALMVMRREIALECGGFDSRYAIGDFEDADLCMKVRSMGLDCAVHDDVELFHLERQSQSGGHNNWRQNLTLVNAWAFGERWADELGDAAPAIEVGRIA